MSFLESFTQLLKTTKVSELAVDPSELLYAHTTGEIWTKRIGWIRRHVGYCQLSLMDETKWPGLSSWTAHERFTYPCTELIGRSIRKDYAAICKDASIFEAIESMSSRRGVHRLVVMTRNGHPWSVITQATILEFLSKHSAPNVMGSIAEVTIGTLRIGTFDVERIKESELAISAFLQLYQRCLQGIAVVSEHDEDTVVSNISLSDLKDIGASTKSLRKLFVPLSVYTEHRKANGDVPKLVFVTSQFTLQETIDVLATLNVHRAYICEADANTNNKRKLAGVVTLSDVLDFFANNVAA